MGWGPLCLAVVLLGFATGCAPADPKVRNLREGVELVESIARSRRLVAMTRDVDADLRPSSAVSVMFSSAGVAGWPTPPDDVALAPDRPTRPWVVVARAVDAQGAIVVSGYGESMERPLEERVVPFPP